MKSTFVGLDVGRTKGACCILAENGSIVKRFTFSTDRPGIHDLSRSLPKQAKIAVETSTNGYAIAQILIRQGFEVTMSNPLLTKAIAASKIKTDAVDAKTLAELLRCGYLPTVWIPDANTQELRLLVSHRALLQKIITHGKNKIQSVLYRNLLTAPGSSLFSKKGLAWLATHEFPPCERVQLDTMLALITAAQTQKETIEQELGKHVYASAEAQLLLTIPGIDYVSALSILSAIGDISRFRSPKKLASYFGLCPSLYESGQTSYKGRITKRGNRLVRWTLVQCANIAVKIDHPLKAFYLRIRAKKGHNVAIIAAARKLLVIIWNMLTRQQGYLFERPHITSNKLAKLRVKVTGKHLKTGPKKPKTQEPTVLGGRDYRHMKQQKEECLNNGHAREGFPVCLMAQR